MYFANACLLICIIQAHCERPLANWNVVVLVQCLQFQMPRKLCCDILFHIQEHEMDKLDGGLHGTSCHYK